MCRKHGAISVTTSLQEDALSSKDIARVFSHTPESVAVAQVVSLWRRYSTVKTLMAEALTKPKPSLAMQFLAAVGIDAAVNVTAELSAGVRARLPSGKRPVSFGGLTLAELESLLRRYKSGQRNPAAYLLLCRWKRELVSRNADKAIDPRLVALTVEAVRRATAAGNATFFREYASAIDAVKSAKEFTEGGRWDHNPAGNADEWRYELLRYIRSQPKPRYRMREFRRHLADECEFKPDPKTIRKFCAGHGIALDARAGAPRRSERNARPVFVHANNNQS